MFHTEIEISYSLCAQTSGGFERLMSVFLSFFLSFFLSSLDFQHLLLLVYIEYIIDSMNAV